MKTPLETFKRANSRFSELVRENVTAGALDFRLATELLKLQAAQLESWLQERQALTAEIAELRKALTGVN